jgi:hypothetical protein
MILMNRQFIRHSQQLLLSSLPENELLEELFESCHIESKRGWPAAQPGVQQLPRLSVMAERAADNYR